MSSGAGLPESVSWLLACYYYSHFNQPKKEAPFGLRRRNDGEKFSPAAKMYEVLNQRGHEEALALACRKC